MQLHKIIEALGYSRSEARVYLTALSLGETYVSTIAQKVRLPRSTTQTIVDRLHKDGLMNFYVRKRYKFWVAERPAHLLQKLQEHEDAVRAVIPRLEALRRADSGKPRIKVLEGVDEIRHIYGDMIETKQPILSISPWDDWIALMGRGFMNDFIASRVRHFLRIRLLTPRTALAQELKTRDAKELRIMRFIPADERINTAIFIYGDKVAMISLNKKLPTAIVAQDSDITNTMTLFFEALWNRSSD